MYVIYKKLCLHFLLYHSTPMSGVQYPLYPGIEIFDVGTCMYVQCRVFKLKNDFSYLYL